jgi:hypothetical protein
VPTRGPLYPLVFSMRYAWRIGWGGSGTRDPALKARVNFLQMSVTYRLKYWRNEQWSDTLESLGSEDQSLWKMKNSVMRDPTPSSTPC